MQVLEGSQTQKDSFSKQTKRKTLVSLKGDCRWRRKKILVVRIESIEVKKLADV